MSNKIPCKLLCLISCFFLSCSKPEQSNQKPNVILIVADDLGWADVSAYGSTFYETPNLDRLCSDGVRFTNGYATCPVCSPSRASIQTGMYPIATGVTDWIKGRKFWTGPTPNDRWIVPDTDYEMKLEEQTIAELLKNDGYATGFFGKWHLGEDSVYWPEAQGYDANIGGWEMGRPNLNRKKGLNGYFSPYGNPRLTDGPDGEYLPERLTEEAIAFIKDQGDNPFYINLSFYLVHTPLQAKEEMITKYQKKAKKMGLDTIQDKITGKEWMKYATGSVDSFAERVIQSNPEYAAMVESLDENIGRLVAFLKQENLYDNSLIIFTSDNGGLSTKEGSPTSNLPLRAGKGWIYEGGIRVPFIVKDIKQEKAGTEIDYPVASIDIMPTVLEKVRVKNQVKSDGISLGAIINGKVAEESRPLFWYYPHYGNQGGNPAGAVRLGDYKLIHDIETGAYELYNLKEDIGEKKSIVKSEPEKTKRLKQLLTEWLAQYELKEFMENPSWNGIDPIVE